MSDHEFEKQVHQKLEELKLRPSDSVWMEVEKSIRQHRRRRFPWLWMAALLVTITTSGVALYYFTNDADSTAKAQAAVATVNNTTTTTGSANNTGSAQATNAIDGTATKGSPATPAQSPTTVSSEPATVVTTPPAAVQGVQADQPQNVVAPAAPSIAAHNNTAAPAAKQSARNSKNNKANNTAITNEYHTGSATQPLVNNTNEPVLVDPANNYGYTREKQRLPNKRTSRNTIAPQPQPVQQEVVVAATGFTPAGVEEHDLSVMMPVRAADADQSIATSKAEPAVFHLSFPDSFSNYTAANITIPRQRASMWHWGIVADAGYSRIAKSKLLQLKGLLGTDKYLVEDLARYPSSAPVQPSNSFLNVSAGTATVPKSASPIQADFSFSAGLFVQRIITPRFRVSAGLEYSYMSVNTQTGQKVHQTTVVNQGNTNAAVVQDYYRYAGAVGGQGNIQNAGLVAQKYRYRFQYLEIPLKANLQLNKALRMPPIAFEGGVSIAHLIAVDALHYEGIKGVYYKDNSLFNKTQFNFVTGLSVGLLQRSKHPLWIGPDLRYSLNGLVKRDVSEGQYLWSAGISVKVLLGRL